MDLPITAEPWRPRNIDPMGTPEPMSASSKRFLLILTVFLLLAVPITAVVIGNR